MAKAIEKSEEKEKVKEGEKVEEKRIEKRPKERPVVITPPEEKIEKIEEEEKVEEETLTNDERQILVVLDFVQKHKASLKIIGFQIKDFLEKIFPNKNIDEIYSKLKEKDFVSKTKDSEEFWVTYKGSEEVEKYKHLLETVFKSLGSKIGDFLEKNELLRRILYLAYLDEWKLRNYIPKISDKLNETEQMLITFFLNREFLQTPIIEKAVRELRKEQPKLIKEKLEEFCKDPDFLKALAILRLDEIKNKIGIVSVASIYHKSYSDTLSEIIEKTKVSDILSKLFLLGITESENLFEIDIDSVLTKEENISRLKEWLIFDRDKFKNQLEVNWNLFLDTKKVIEGSTPSDLKDLINANAILFYKDKFLVRREVKEIYDEVYKKIEEKLKEKVKDVDNVIVFPFYDIGRDKLKELKGKIIVSLHAEDWWSRKYYYPAIKEDELEKNVILLVSPKEIGFKADKEKILSSGGRVLELPDKNVEFNAIGQIENLDKVKSNFNTCEWVLEEEYQSVKRAKEIIEEKKIPKIQLDEAIEEIKKDPILTNMLYIISKMYSHNPHYKSYFWSDVKSNIMNQYEIDEEKFEDLKKKLIELIEKRAKVTFEEFYGKDIINEKCKNDIINQIKNTVENLDDSSKRALYVFLMIPFDWIYENFLPEEKIKWIGKFKAYYNFLFNQTFKKDVITLLLKTGLVFRETWITWKGKNNGLVYKVVDFFKEIKPQLMNILEKTVKIEKPEIKHFIEKYESDIIELSGLDFLLSSGGVCKREELREYLWKISLEAWNKFESHTGIISSKDGEIIAINPLLLDRLKEFVNDCKKTTIKKQERLKDLLLSAKIIDHKIEFDEELGIYKGFIVTSGKEEIKVIIAPWYLPAYEKYFGEKTILLITNQEGYETFVKSIKEKDEKITLFFLQNNNLSVYSSFDKYNFTNSIISLFEKKGYKLKTKELEFEEIAEEKEVTPEKEIPAEETAAKLLAGIEGRSILDNMFTPLGRKRFSSLFGVTSYKPRCVIITGNRKQGKKIIEDLIKEELTFWGMYTPKTKQSDEVEKRVGVTSLRDKELEDIRDIIKAISEEENRIVSIEISPKHLDWIEKIIERLKEVETQGLKFVIFHLEEKVPKGIIEKIESETSIPSYIFSLPMGEKVSKATQQLSMMYGGGIEVPLEIDNLDAFWNYLQREMNDIIEKMKEKIDGDDELKDITLLKKESVLHYVLRGLTCKYLRRSGYQVTVETPEKTEEGKIVPDLIAFKKDEKIFVEAETCIPTMDELEEYGLFINPEKRLKDKIQKYEGKENVSLILAIPNIFGIIHQRVLKNIKKYLKTKFGMRTSIHMIDWSSYPAKLVKIM